MYRASKKDGSTALATMPSSPHSMSAEKGAPKVRGDPPSCGPLGLSLLGLQQKIDSFEHALKRAEAGISDDAAAAGERACAQWVLLMTYYK